MEEFGLRRFPEKQASYAGAAQLVEKARQCFSCAEQAGVPSNPSQARAVFIVNFSEEFTATQLALTRGHAALRKCQSRSKGERQGASIGTNGLAKLMELDR